MASDAVEDRFLKWLMTPKDERKPKTQWELAQEFDMSSEALGALKRKPEFLEKWNTRYLTTISNPTTKMSIMATLLRTATDQDDPKHVQAAKAYFEIEGSLKPVAQKVDIKVQAQKVSDLSDADLQRLLAAKADDELAKRREAS